MLEVICSVATNGRNPILFLPSSPAGKALPRGPLPIVANGFELEARVAKIAINAVYATGPTAGKTNLLGDILRGWFGLDAGKPGRRERVRIRPAGRRWLMEPVTCQVDTQQNAA